MGYNDSLLLSTIHALCLADTHEWLWRVQLAGLHFTRAQTALKGESLHPSLGCIWGGEGHVLVGVLPLLVSGNLNPVSP